VLEDQNLVVNQFFTLWAVLDPIGHLPLFLGATGDLTARDRRRAAILGVLIAFVILVAFGIAGQVLLEAMGISLKAFQIAGGIILLLFALRMVLGDSGPAAKAAADAPDGVMAVAIYPLATPIIAGPGSMLAVILLTDNNRFTFVQQAETLGVLAVVLCAMTVIFLLGDAIARVIGHGGTNVLRRIMGMILAALSVNMITNALSAWLSLPPI
jgi:multiple antibiotic resistance protein